jgi:hypothetical protein
VKEIAFFYGPQAQWHAANIALLNNAAIRYDPARKGWVVGVHGEHSWPAELESDAQCENGCGLRYAEWDEGDPGCPKT